MSALFPRGPRSPPGPATPLSSGSSGRPRQPQETSGGARSSTSEDLGAGAYDTAVETTTAVGGTAGYPVFTELTFTGNDIGDTLAAGDAFRLKVYRDVSDAADTVNSNDAELIAVEMRLV